MAQSDEELPVAKRLGQLLDRGLLPAGGPAEAAERLIERLERPARVALLGLPGAGKSAILNLLTGTVVVPETLRLPTIIVQHGTEARMLCTLTDGRVQTLPGSDLNDVLALNPALVTLEMDLPALKVISLLEVSAGPMEAEQRRAAIWASKRADILIWCTTSYLPKEQQVWEGMPDVVKDNGFLFLTKVDLLGSREAAQGMLERVELRAGEEFRQVLSISAKQARAAMLPGGQIDRELFRDSGATAVITTIKSRVQAARRADTDMAELLLARHVEAGGIVARRFAEPDETPVAQPAPEWVPPPEEVRPATTFEASPPEQEPEVLEPEPEATAADVEPDPPLADPVAEPTPAEPEPLPDPVPEPEPVRAALSRPAFARPTEPPPAPADGRKRFSDRIKQMPVPDDVSGAAMVPLRTTWKSKAETAAAARRPAADPAPAEQPSAAPVTENRLPRPETRARPAAPRNEEPGAEDAALARMLASVVTPQPETPETRSSTPEPAPEEPLATPPETEAAGLTQSAEEQDADAIPESGEEGADTARDDDETAAAIDLPRWAERLAPIDPNPPSDRPARASLFGARKPAAPAATSPAAPVARPAERAARPAAAVERVRAPAPRPSEPPRPAVPSPEDLATPRIVAMRDRPQPAAGSAETAPRAERRERPRIARVVSAAPAPAAAAAVASSGDQILADEAIREIIGRSAALAAQLNPDDKIPVDLILDHSRITVDRIISILGPAQSTGLRRIMGDLGEIQDLIMLMQLEKGHAPADDALTLLLQIRRDLETLNAA